MTLQFTRRHTIDERLVFSVTRTGLERESISFLRCSLINYLLPVRVAKVQKDEEQKEKEYHWCGQKGNQRDSQAIVMQRGASHLRGQDLDLHACRENEKNVLILIFQR